MYINQLSLINQRIRNALKKYDAKEVTLRVLDLVYDDQYKADQLANWFRKIAQSCKNSEAMSPDIAIMRMWQIGNVDIKGLTKHDHLVINVELRDSLFSCPPI